MTTSRPKIANFINYEIESKADPKTYNPPIRKRRSLQSGDLTEIDAAGELILVGIYRVFRGAYFGRVIFPTRLGADHGLEGGDRVKFVPANVCRAMRGDSWLS